MIQVQALRVADALVVRSRQLLQRLEERGLVMLDYDEGKEFAAELIDIARAVILGADDAGGAEIIDFTALRLLRIAQATPGDGDAA